MKEGYDKVEVDRILSTLREAMRALVARTTLTHDNQLFVTQNLLRATYSGWNSQDVPASVPMVMRDLAVKHDQELDAEIARIAGAFETADRMIRRAVELEDESPRLDEVVEEDDEEEDDEDDVGDQPKVSVLDVICKVAKSLPIKEAKSDAKDMMTLVAEHIKSAKSAKTLDELIESCLSSGFQTSRSELRRCLRELEANGDVVEIPGSPQRYTMLDMDLTL